MRSLPRLKNNSFFFNRSIYRYLPFASDTAGSSPHVSRRRRRCAGFRSWSSRGSLRRKISASQPSKLIPFRMFRNETSLLSEQLHRQYIRGYHNDHGNVKGDQRTEHEERSVVNHARPWSRHDIQGIYYTCKITNNFWTIIRDYPIAFFCTYYYNLQLIDPNNKLRRWNKILLSEVLFLRRSTLRVCRVG